MHVVVQHTAVGLPLSSSRRAPTSTMAPPRSSALYTACFVLPLLKLALASGLPSDSPPLRAPRINNTHYSGKSCCMRKFTPVRRALAGAKAEPIRTALVRLVVPNDTTCRAAQIYDHVAAPARRALRARTSRSTARRRASRAPTTRTRGRRRTATCTASATPATPDPTTQSASRARLARTSH